MVLWGMVRLILMNKKMFREVTSLEKCLNWEVTLQCMNLVRTQEIYYT